MSPQTDHYWRNRDKILAKRREDYWADPEASRAKSRDKYYRSQNYRLKTRYGITLDEWNALFSIQDRSCAICGDTEPSGQGWCTDHDHGTGEVRGILCHFCNSLLGYARDNAAILSRAVEYLNG